MKWGSFGAVHFATLVLAAVMVTALYFSIRKAPRKVQTAVLGVLSLSGVFAIVYNLVRWDAPIYYLPLHLCSINAMLLPIAVFTRNKTIGNLLGDDYKLGIIRYEEAYDKFFKAMLEEKGLACETVAEFSFSP